MSAEGAPEDNGEGREDYIYVDPTSSTASQPTAEEREWIDGEDQVYQTSQKIIEAVTFLPSIGGGDGPEDFDYCMVLPTCDKDKGFECTHNGDIFYITKCGFFIKKALEESELHCELVPQEEEASKRRGSKKNSFGSMDSWDGPREVPFEVPLPIHNHSSVCFLLIRAASIDVLRRYALSLDDNDSSSSTKRSLYLLCDMDALAGFANKYSLRINDGVDKNGDKYCPTYTPFESIYVKYTDQAVPERLYWRPNDLSHPFRSSVRLTLLMQIIDHAILRDNGTASRIIIV